VTLTRNLLSQQPGPYKDPLAGNNACAVFVNDATATAVHSEKVVIVHQPGQTLPNKDKFVQLAGVTGTKGSSHQMFVNQTSIIGDHPNARLDLAQITINVRTTDGSLSAIAATKDSLAVAAALLADPTFVEQLLANQI
jgi:hypothetical protein